MQLLVELRGQGLVVGEDERRPVDRLDDFGDGERLSGSRDAQKGLVGAPGLQSFDQPVDGLLLIPLRRKLGLQAKASARARLGVPVRGRLRLRRSRCALLAKTRPGAHAFGVARSDADSARRQ
jgi:hypothetical protein